MEIFTAKKNKNVSHKIFNIKNCIIEMKKISKLGLMSIILLIICLQPVVAQTEWETVIPGNSLTAANFDTYWEWFYPWGDTHNGSAKMYVDQVTLDTSGTATIIAQTPDSSSSYKYRSGAFNSKSLILCNGEYSEWNIQGEFRAPSVKGSWPAFWITSAGPWTSEVDILEFKGDANNWFNTYDGGWESKLVPVEDSPDVWHKYQCHLIRLNENEARVEFYFDDKLVATHTGSNFVGTPFDVIINLQMEGSSGSPGPAAPTYYYVRNIVVQRKTEATPPGPPTTPMNLKATFGDSEIGLEWDASPEWDVDYYSVYRSATSGGPYDLITSDADESGYTDIGLVNNTTYYYVVTATDLDGNESSKSNEVSMMPVDLYPVTVENYSFELPGTQKQQNWENVPGWNSDSRASDSGEESAYSPTDGLWRGFLMSSDPSVWNLTDHTILDGEKFQLAIDARSSDNFKISLYYDNEGSRVVMAAKIVDPGSDYGRFVLTCAADSVPASIGEIIGIELDNIDPGTSWVGFDNVRLSSSYDLTDVELIPSNDKEKLKSFRLDQNYPNPFNPSTTINYSIPRKSFVQLKIYDALGKEVANLVNGNQIKGNYKVEFDASKLPSGVYFYKLQSGDFINTKKLILLK